MYPRHLNLILALALLILALILQGAFNVSSQNTGQYIADIKDNLYQELEQSDKFLEEVREQIVSNKEGYFSYLNTSTEYPFYIFKSSKIIYWSDHQFVPDYDSLSGNYKNKFITLSKGKFIVKKKSLLWENQYFEIFSLIPVYLAAPVNNDYLKASFNEKIFSNPALQIIHDANEENTFPIDDSDGNYLFSIIFNEHYKFKNKPFQLFIIFLIFISILLFTFYVLSWGKYFAKNQQVISGLFFLIFCFIFLRVLMLGFNFPFSMLALDLFSPRYFASSLFNPSIGDLLLNILIILPVSWYLFKYYNTSSTYRHIFHLKGFQKGIISVFLALFSCFILFFQYFILDTIIANAQWSLDITTSIEFSGLKIVSLFIFFINAIIYFQLSHVTFKLFIHLNENKEKWMFIYFIGGLLLYFIIAYLAGVAFFIIILVNAVYFIALYRLSLTKALARVQYITFLYLIINAVIVSIVCSFAIFSYEYERLIDHKQHFANPLLIENDILAEALLSEAAESILHDTLIGEKLYKESIQADIESRIGREYLSNYFDKYNITMSFFNKKGLSLKNDTLSPSYTRLRSQFNKKQYKTDFKNLFFVSKPDLSKRYLYFIEIRYKGRKAGFIVLDLFLKKIVPNSVYPELFVDKRFLSPILDRTYSYAVYDDKKFVYSMGDFNYTKEDSLFFANSKLFGKGIYQNSMHHLGIKGAHNKLIIISSPFNTIKLIISNFSFLFLILVLGIVLALVIQVIYVRTQKIDLNVSTKIQLYMNFAFFLPLLVVSLSTVSLTGSIYSEKVIEQFYRKAERMGNNIANSLNTYIKDPSYKEELANQVAQMSKYAEADINLFDIQGKLITSSQPMIYENKFISNYLNINAFDAIFQENNNHVVLDEVVGKLKYKSAYWGIKSYDKGDLIGVLSLPFFESRQELNQQLINITTNVLNVFIIIFLISLFLSYFASKALTYPLHYLTQKIKHTSFYDHNEPLIWNSDDEIGLLVDEYNKMLVNLELSREALAKSEKESAWREMAKHVAHEIKNPLTPMKLSLQHMRRKLINESLIGASHFSTKTIDSLLEQIDTLSDIATSFSAFAKMPIPKNEPVEIISILKDTSSLYNNDKSVNIKTFIEGEKVYVRGDRKLMGRIISNLIINGVQSVPKNRKPSIEVHLTIDKDTVLIEVKDNGLGIPEPIQDKVFLPNFSTKYTGSGIGLAIAKRGIEHAGGRIWFETEENTGTSFFIVLPLSD